MNIILKSFLITLVVMLVIFLTSLIGLLPELYSFIIVGVTAFTLIWVFVYALLK
jgi:hypothetical protein